MQFWISANYTMMIYKYSALLKPFMIVSPAARLGEVHSLKLVADILVHFKPYPNVPQNIDMLFISVPGPCSPE